MGAVVCHFTLAPMNRGTMGPGGQYVLKHAITTVHHLQVWLFRGFERSHGNFSAKQCNERHCTVTLKRAQDKPMRNTFVCVLPLSDLGLSDHFLVEFDRNVIGFKTTNSSISKANIDAKS